MFVDTRFESLYIISDSKASAGREFNIRIVLQKKKRNSVCKSITNVRIHNSQGQVSLFQSNKISYSSDRIIKHKPHCPDAPMNQ